MRPVYPGAALVDARFLDDGQVALLVGLAAQAGAPGAGRELWRLDPTTGQAARVHVPGVEGSASTLVLAPDGGAGGLRHAGLVGRGHREPVAGECQHVRGTAARASPGSGVGGVPGRHRAAAAQEAPADEVLPPEATSRGVPVAQLPPELDRTWAYTTADPVRPDVLGLATLDGRYAFQPSAACHSGVWSVADGQEVMLYVVAGHGAWIAPLTADGHLDAACPIQVQARMSTVP